MCCFQCTSVHWHRGAKEPGNIHIEEEFGPPPHKKTTRTDESIIKIAGDYCNNRLLINGSINCRSSTVLTFTGTIVVEIGNVSGLHSCMCWHIHLFFFNYNLKKISNVFSAENTPSCGTTILMCVCGMP